MHVHGVLCVSLSVHNNSEGTPVPNTHVVFCYIHTYIHTYLHTYKRTEDRYVHTGHTYTYIHTLYTYIPCITLNGHIHSTTQNWAKLYIWICVVYKSYKQLILAKYCTKYPDQALVVRYVCAAQRPDSKFHLYSTRKCSSRKVGWYITFVCISEKV